MISSNFLVGHSCRTSPKFPCQNSICNLFLNDPTHVFFFVCCAPDECSPRPPVSLVLDSVYKTFARGPWKEDFRIARPVPVYKFSWRLFILTSQHKGHVWLLRQILYNKLYPCTGEIDATYRFITITSLCLIASAA